ncbi:MULTISPECIES: glucuronide transporter [Enterobacteriaceae]|uniref:Glucuronide transporter n=3 Tax=Enterobacteriaceae TaxID=543 RepID=A0A9X7KY14_9ENTR|nr:MULTISPECIES: glucuronide transporter [Enterobacteriaceae]MCU2585248.1 glucuronide transporter [Enterobacter hormaechei subsp. steigerwaltii]CAH5930941.1 Glucuronide carrier protein [Klebsiella pneumoniae]HCA0186562.1 glucuronide transporter [Raoultella ornithinolytica]KTI41184.1 glucuronide transporter [Enterobacter hormaechei subsp. xiangfangensis]KTJ96128.1 glucuronide transporter [Enterobacter hormaechei subsp. xiangfangensis]
MSQQLSWRAIIGYSLGDVANNFAFAMGALFLLSYYTDVAGVGAAAAGTMLLLVRVFDAFADVTVGRIVDSVNTRWGKFRPFLLFGSAPLMIFSVLVFCVPAEWSHSSKVIYAYITYMGLGICYSLVNIPYGSLATAMTQQPQSRARLGAARSIAASLTFVCLAFLIGPRISSASPTEMQDVYLFWTIILAVAGTVLYFVCFKSTKENVVRIVAQPSMKISLQTVKQNRPLIMLCAGALCVLISTFAVSASSLFYVRYVLNDAGLFSVMVLVQMLIGTVASAPMVPRLVTRVGKKNTFLIGSLLGTSGYLLFFYMSAHSVPVALTALAIASVGQGISMTVMWALEADTVEYGEYLTGVRIEGLTYSLFSFTRKCGQAIGGSIPAFILGLSGYIANQAQTPEVIMGIRMSIALVPCGFLLLAFIIMWFYPLTDQKFKEIILEIDTRKKTQQKLIDDFKK